MWLSVLIAALGPIEVAPPEREAAVIEACVSWMATRGLDGPAIQKIESDGLCFIGGTDDANSAAFVEAVAGVDAATPLVVVVESNGGEINAAMAMAEVLVPRQTTVVAHRWCMSSCANYLFLAGDRRVVMADAVLAYHGGIYAESEAYWTKMREDFAKRMNDRDLEASMAASRAYADSSLSRQNAFLKSVNVDPDLFDWMQSFNRSSDAARLALCPVPDAIAYLPSEALLAERGIVIHSNDGPKSDAELAAVLAARGLSGLVCYWD